MTDSSAVCDCEFTPDPDDPAEDGTPGNEPWHYLRTCAFCTKRWWGLHCPHDGAQNPCGNCGKRPIPIPITDNNSVPNDELREKLKAARALIFECPHLRFDDPPSLAIDRFIDVVLGGDGSNPFPFRAPEEPK